MIRKENLGLQDHKITKRLEGGELEVETRKVNILYEFREVNEG